MCKDQNTVVSVIIPTFNVEKYVEQCLRSLLEQTFREFEVICVDDGSSDGTIEIIKRIQAEDDRICLIEKEHCGRAGVMRNIGLEEARGEYCLFLDADDFFEKEMIDRVLTKIREEDVYKRQGLNWYVSAFFFAELFYFLMYKAMKNSAGMKLIICLIVYFGYVLNIMYTDGGFARKVVFGVFSLAMARAAAGVGLGYLLGNLYEMCIRDRRETVSTSSTFSSL